MARPTTTTKREQYRHKQTRYIYRLVYRSIARAETFAIPRNEGSDIITLRFEGRHPEDENTIVVTAAELEKNFDPYQPIRADKPEPVGEAVNV